MLDLKQREGIQKNLSILFQFLDLISIAFRRIGDTKSRLETIYAKQRQLNASVAVTEQDRRAAHLMSKMSVCLLFYQKTKSENKIFLYNLGY